MSNVEIKVLSAENFEIESHIELLIDAVESGASIGFVAPISREDAADYWLKVRHSLQVGHILMGAYLHGKLVGSVQLSASQKANAMHRAEIEKLMVLRCHRGQGIAVLLMGSIEKMAENLGRWLLILDTKLGDVAEGLYEKIGYTRVGTIPNFAANSGGGYGGTVIFYKQLFNDCGLP